jgi:hypothetical protein
VLAYLGVEAAQPDLAGLDALVDAYIRNVPWESVFRITKRAHTKDTTQCPRWPDEFWSDAMQRGGGGTCFESNYAFFSLLRGLGYDGYLTINNMEDSIGCHSAIILNIADVLWLTDVGIPLHVPIPVPQAESARRAGPFHNYTLTTTDNHRYRVERDCHPNPYIYTLINSPVDDAKYRAATSLDYDKNGHFLDRAIINIVSGERMWRFDGSEKPFHLESFQDGQRSDHVISGDVVTTVAKTFGVDKYILRQALEITYSH